MMKETLKLSNHHKFELCACYLISFFQMLLHLFSDANYNLLGFNATYTFSLCPGACGGHGRCDPSTSKCHCHQGWGGAACTTPMCSQACSVNGQCDKVKLGRGKV